MDVQNISKREVILICSLTASFFLAILIIIWARTPDYRPLIQDMRLADAVKIVDVLELEGIQYKADIKSHILYVNSEQSAIARLALARVGIVIEYPTKSSFSPIPEACKEIEGNSNIDSYHKPVWEQEWFMKVVRLQTGALVLIILILAVVRPILRTLIYPDEK